MTVYVLTFEFSDKSSFRVCGVTEHYAVAQAWYFSSPYGEHKVYAIQVGQLKSWDQGFEPWSSEQER